MIGRVNNVRFRFARNLEVRRRFPQSDHEAARGESADHADGQKPFGGTRNKWNIGVHRSPHFIPMRQVFKCKASIFGHPRSSSEVVGATRLHPAFLSGKPHP